MNNLYLAITAALLIFSTIVIFTTKKAYPLRFMYPGLITFIFFMILPICFTLYIAFTNLSTGHLLSKEELLKTVLQEKYIEENQEALSFKLFKSKDKNLIIVERKYFSYYLENQKNIILKKINNKAFETSKFKKLNLSQIYQLKNNFSNKKFILPDNTELFFHRVDKLIALKKRYTLKTNGDLLDNKFKTLYHPDDEKGFFKSQKGNLSPGYFTTVGFYNFKKLFTNQSYRKPLFKLFSWTFSWAFFSVLTTFIVGLLFALLLNDKKLTLRPIYRIFIIIPYSIPFFISVLIFKGMLNQDFGIINQLISGDKLVKLPWLTDPFFAKISCLLVNLWLGFPYMFLIITGILQSIPSSIYEAASLDGASKFVQLKTMTLPLIMSSIGPLLVGSFAFNMNNFVGIYLLTGGGPPLSNTTTPLGETDILISYTYRLAFEGAKGQDFALASSISLIIFFIVATLTIINFKITGMGKNEQA